MRVETVEHLEEAKRKAHVVHINLEIRAESDLPGLAIALEDAFSKSSNSGLCSIALGGGLEVDNGQEQHDQLFRLLKVIGNMETLKSLTFDRISGAANSFTREMDLNTFEVVFCLPVRLLTTLIKDVSPRLESLVFKRADLMGTSQDYDKLFLSLQGLKCLRRFECDEPYELRLFLDDAGRKRYTFEGAVVAISKLPLLVDVMIQSDDFGGQVDEQPFRQTTVPQLHGILAANALLSSPTIQSLDLSSTHSQSMTCQRIGKALELNHSLKTLDLMIGKAPDNQPDLLKQLGFLAHALRVNNSLQELTLHLFYEEDDPLPNMTPFVKDVAKALSTNSTMVFFELKADNFVYDASGDDALIEMFATNHTLLFLNLIQLEEDSETGMHPSKTTEIDLFLRLNRNGRKRMLRDNDNNEGTHASRDEWCETFAKLSNDFDALHYYLRRDPGLVQYLITVPGESVAIINEKESKKRRFTDVSHTVDEHQKLVKRMRQLEEENRALRKENADLKAQSMPR